MISQDILGNVHYVREINVISLGSLIKTLSPVKIPSLFLEQNKLKEI